MSLLSTNVLVAQDNQLFADFKGDVYEIVSTFRPSADTKKVGFNLRVGDGEQTKVYYDLETEKLVLDRSQSVLF
nr:GH32 C-terminal domain-containing protein [Enterococcus sp. DA9]